MMKINQSIIAFLFIPAFAFSQKPGWQHNDLATDGQFGISTAKAYDLLKGKRHKKIIVAVIDSGIDTAHEDLKAVLSPKGWGLLGNKKGENIEYENLELVRILKPLHRKFGGAMPADSTGYAEYKSLYAKYKIAFDPANRNYQNTLVFKKVLDTIVTAISKPVPALADFKEYRPASALQTNVTQFVIKGLARNPDFTSFYAGSITTPLEYYGSEVNYHLNLAFSPRAIIGDDPDNMHEKHYGNHDLTGPDAKHGTHVAGIIGAVRGNGIGLDGIADDVSILSIRTVPDGDERDKDVALAIRYAVKHGAKVINMSFGKAYGTDKAAVDAAARYAIRHDVLLVQAAGNEGKNIDTAANFPNRIFEDGEIAKGWIVVGASGPADNNTLKAGFSNYGSRSVDVFAPGVRIYSSVPGSKYDTYDGTSMAAPVVAGLAALIREYYPKLKAGEVKDIIMRSVVKRDVLNGRCISGGIVNAVQAISLAEEMTNNK